MSSYFLGRFGSLIASLLVASIVIFLILEVVPGDPAQFMLGLNANPETLANLRAQMGLDQPAVTRYITWVLGMLHGDFGISYTYKTPVTELVLQRLGVSLPLALLSLLLTILIAFPAGILAGGIIIENVFFLPGLGRLVFQGITQRDLIVVKSVVMLLVFAVILVNFLVDLSYIAVDPRLRRR